MNWIAAELAGQIKTPSFELFDALPGQVYREVEARSTRRVHVAGQDCFIKLHRGIGWREIVRSLVTLRWPVCDAGTEVRALRRLAQHGLRCARVLAWGRTGWNPARRRSYVLLEALDEFVSLEDRVATGIAARERRALCGAVGSLLRRMHTAGVNHRDLYICHVLQRRDAAPVADSLSLLDLHRAQVRTRVPRRWQIKDVASLLYSAQDARLSRRDMLRFVVAYTGREYAHLRRDGSFWRAVRVRAAGIAARERRLGQRDTALSG